MKKGGIQGIVMVLSIFLLFLSGKAGAQAKHVKVNCGIILAEVGVDGVRSLSESGSKGFTWPVGISSGLEGCIPEGEVGTTNLPGGGFATSRLLKNISGGMSAVLTERFMPAGNNLHCEIEIQGTGKPWTATISTSIKYHAGPSSRIWAPWGDPRISTRVSPGSVIQNSGGTGNSKDWNDPLQPRTFFDDTLYYGAPYFTYENPGIAFIPFQWDLLCIPMVTLMEVDNDHGISMILDPDDNILDLTMKVSADGSIIFNRIFNRISDRNLLKFSFDIVIHEADWRGGLRWMSRAYPEYFNPVNPKADTMAGTGGYSDSDVDFDVAKMEKMAFSINWRASFDFPYMGMFIPPVAQNETWTRFGGSPTSVSAMESYAGKMKKMGFHVLSYFNVTEFGARMTYPLQPLHITNEADLWKSANDFLSAKLGGALLRVPDRVPQEKLGFYSKTKQGGAYFTWEDGLVTDCGEPAYRAFLLDQAQKHISLIPSSEGICIDRLDWLRMYNEERDDSISWYLDRPARSLVTSWKDLMKYLAPLMHKNDKVIFVNNHDKRIDLLKNTDGIFDEFTYAGVPLNLTALLCINKPALGWTSDSGPIKSEGADSFFQKYLYLGVYPMAPFPGNDHSIRPDDWTDNQYLDYGPLLALMKGKKWVLEPHCIKVIGDLARVNLFRLTDGYLVPVVFGKENKVTVEINNIAGLGKATCEAFYPGSENGVAVKADLSDGYLSMEVPLKRGCAMVKIKM